MLPVCLVFIVSVFGNFYLGEFLTYSDMDTEANVKEIQSMKLICVNLTILLTR